MPADALYGGEESLITINMNECQEARPDVHEMFFQVFDKGIMEDGESRFINFKNTLILLSTNAGTELIASMCKDPDLLPQPEGLPRRSASRC